MARERKLATPDEGENRAIAAYSGATIFDHQPGAQVGQERQRLQPENLRVLADSFDPAIVARVDAMLAEVKEQHRATVLLAVESGSTAWGFPSPDSDYDCRFIFVRPPEGYLRLFALRDVIEFPTDGLVDVNGWDLAKALRLLLRGSAVVIEWLTSPFTYACDSVFRDEALSLAREVARAPAIARHYLHLGERQRRTYLAGAAIEIKKIFYVLRPAMALRWLRLHPGAAVAPMHFPTLASESDLRADIAGVVNDMIARKAKTRELGSGTLPPAVREFMDEEFALARALWLDEPWRPSEADIRAADDLLRRWISP
jgi:predicted nucleotidyltransferase